MNAGFDADQARRAEEIRGAGKAQSVFSATARGDLSALSREVAAREQSIRRKSRKLLGSTKKSRTTVEGEPEEAASEVTGRDGSLRGAKAGKAHTARSRKDLQPEPWHAGGGPRPAGGRLLRLA